MAGARVHDAAAAETSADAPRHFPCLEQFLARQAFGAADDARDAMKQRVVRKPAEVVGGEPGLRGRIEHVTSIGPFSSGAAGGRVVGAEPQPHWPRLFCRPAFSDGKLASAGPAARADTRCQISPRLANRAMCSAARNASAEIVSVGWPRDEVTMLLPSQMKRFRTSCVAVIAIDHR